MKTAYLEPFPLPPLIPSDSNKEDMLERIVSLAESMLHLHKQLASAKTTHDKTVIQRQIDATDKQIDQLIYQLYGLTDEEIQIVESATSS